MRQKGKHWGMVAALGIGMAALPLTPWTASAAPFFQIYQQDGLRGLVDQTQSDLRSAESLEHQRGKEHERYENAQRTLSTFDRHLTKDHFDKGKLDRVIGDIKSILDHNTLQARSRDALLHDIESLRIARERRGL